MRAFSPCPDALKPTLQAFHIRSKEAGEQMHLSTFVLTVKEEFADSLPIKG